MIYTLRHLTTYRYTRPVRFARCALRLRPRDGEGQTVLESALTISPDPSLRVVRRDYFGLDVVSVTIDGSAQKVTLVPVSSVAAPCCSGSGTLLT